MPASVGVSCGLKATIAESIKDCSRQKSSTQGGFVLVARTKDSKEIWKDTKSGLIWSNQLILEMTSHEAKKACEEGSPELVKLLSVSWRLPFIEEYKEAEGNEFRLALAGMDHYFWSATVRRDMSQNGWLFNGNSGTVIDGGLNTKATVLCVGELKNPVVSK